MELWKWRLLTARWHTRTAPATPGTWPPGAWTSIKRYETKNEWRHELEKFLYLHRKQWVVDLQLCQSHSQYTEDMPLQSSAALQLYITNLAEGNDLGFIFRWLLLWECLKLCWKMLSSAIKKTPVGKLVLLFKELWRKTEISLYYWMKYQCLTFLQAYEWRKVIPGDELYENRESPSNC